MKKILVGMMIVLMLLCFSVLSQAQQSVATSTNAVVPPLVKFGGTLTDLNGKPLSGVVGVTFALYKDQQGGAPLWLETQNVTADKNGHYSIMLGSTSSEGLPTDLFASGEARWLGVQPEGQGEQPRVLLLSVPYALKAGDAQTLGGLPASAFVLAAPPSSSATSPSAESAAATTNASVSPATTSDVTTSGGTVNAIPLFSTATNIQNSLLTQTGTSSVNVGGKLNLPATGTATATAGKNSRPETFVASAFNSTTSTAVPQTFQWQAEPAGNDTASPSGTLNLLYGSGAATPAETNLKIASNGVIMFAPGQTFPGTGTITGVTAGTDLTGGGTSGSVTLNLDTTKVPLLGAANTFTGNQTIAGVLGVGADNSGQALYALQLGTGNAVEAIAGSGTGVYGSSSGSSAFGVEGASPNVGVFGQGTGSGGIGVDGHGTVVGLKGIATATSGAVRGVYGQSGSAAGYGVEGSSANIGVYGINSSGTSVGTFGQVQTESYTGQNFALDYNGGSPPGVGVWGDGSTGSSNWDIGVVGTVDDGSAGVFVNNSAGYTLYAHNRGSGNAAYFQNDDGNSESDTLYVNQNGGGSAGGFHSWGGTTTLWVFNDNPSGLCCGSPFSAYVYTCNDDTCGSNGCYIDAFGDINCTGAKNAVVPIDGGQRKVALSAIESPKNWFEDFGSAQLSNGSAVVAIDPEYGQTINTGPEYHVFLTPNGDCKGLYVSHRTATSFEVHEIGGGTSSIEFSYRMVALRKNFEKIRLADHTDDDPMKMLAKKGLAHTPFRHETAQAKPPGLPAPMPARAVAAPVIPAPNVARPAPPPHR
jgi:hypothetical protein